MLSYPGMDSTGTVVVAPLLAPSAFSVEPVLNPLIPFEGKDYALATEQLAAIPIAQLTGLGSTALDRDSDISRALDRLFFGN